MLDTRLEQESPAEAGLAADVLAAELLGALVPSRFDPARIGAALATFPVPRGAGQEVIDGRGVGLRDGRSFVLSLSPGVVQVGACDRVRMERTAERVGERGHRDADLRSRRLVDVPLTAGGGDVEPSRRITAWSSKSRARMVKAFGEVDWSVLLDAAAPLGMVTLTLPGDWLAVAPDGPTVKKHLYAFRKRFERATGGRLRGAWKLEFQRRGAPHFHLLMACPAMVKGQRFEGWLSKTWADVVGAEGDEYIRHLSAGTGVDLAAGARMSDPKRMGVYFLKHSSKTSDDKEYQHIVPEQWQEPGKGPGRFWGFWGMDKVTESIELDATDFVAARRVLRKVAKARATRIAYDRAKAEAAKQWAPTRPCPQHGGYCRDRSWAGRRAREAADRVRPLRSLGAGGQLTGGFVLVNDGPALAVDLARAVRAARSGPATHLEIIPGKWVRLT